eukprot:TRINITY_DN495_c0_g1_i2.p1 TRINITY_DN495_c0_g1~~TRINITY_DN495_c0_g1_i2.p1  ORF type:complete len:103 (+),score=0.69 TRINITY_DN495_c0_g1_i2:169-477(+)
MTQIRQGPFIGITKHKISKANGFYASCQFSKEGSSHGSTLCEDTSHKTEKYSPLRRSRIHTHVLVLYGSLESDRCFKCPRPMLPLLFTPIRFQRYKFEACIG